MAGEDLNQISNIIDKGMDIVHMVLEPWYIKRRADALEYEFNIVQMIEAKKLNNLENVIKPVQEQVDVNKDDISIDDDWMLKFIDCAQNTSTGEMQEILSRILLRKIKDPNACSIRTLSVMTDLSYDECKLFSKMIRYSVRMKNGTVFILHPDIINGYCSKTTDYPEQMKLSECRLTTIFDPCYRINPDDEAFLIYDGYVGVIDAHGSMVDSCCLSCLTTAGMEIYHLLENELNIDYDLEFFKYSLESIKRQNGFNVSLHKLVKYECSSIDYYREDLMSNVELNKQ